LERVKKLDMAFCIDALIISGNEIELIENITFSSLPNCVWECICELKQSNNIML